MNYKFCTQETLFCDIICFELPRNLKKNLHATSSTFWQRIINLLGYNQSQTGLVTE